MRYSIQKALHRSRNNGRRRGTPDGAPVKALMSGALAAVLRRLLRDPAGALHLTVTGSIGRTAHLEAHPNFEAIGEGPRRRQASPPTPQVGLEPTTLRLTAGCSAN